MKNYINIEQPDNREQEQTLHTCSVAQQIEVLKAFREFVNKRQNSQHIYNYDVSDYLKTLL